MNNKQRLIFTFLAESNGLSYEEFSMKLNEIDPKLIDKMLNSKKSRTRKKYFDKIQSDFGGSAKHYKLAGMKSSRFRWHVKRMYAKLSFHR